VEINLAKAGDVKRGTRVGERIREELANIISRKVRDPRVVGAIVSRVEVTDDLRSARIYVRLLEGGEDAKKRDLLIEGLSRAAGMLRQTVTKSLALRFAPELKFFYDVGQDKLTRIQDLLDEVHVENLNRGKSS
jgi:ribosome-binding factor A